MPHVIVEYSANIEAEITPQRLVEEIHRAAIASGIAEIRFSTKVTGLTQGADYVEVTLAGAED